MKSSQGVVECALTQQGHSEDAAGHEAGDMGREGGAHMQKDRRSGQLAA